MDAYLLSSVEAAARAHDWGRHGLCARYTRREVIAAGGHASGVKPKVTQGGILWMPDPSGRVLRRSHKAERDYLPTTMYRDYAINRTLFHWESQTRQTPQQEAVQRYIHHRERGRGSCCSCESASRESSGPRRSTSSGQ
jgi:hypothetical protein